MVHISFFLCIGMITVIMRKCQKSQVRTAFLFVLLVMTLWSLGTLFELDFRLITGATFLIFINICYIAICLVPIALLYLGMVILNPNWQIKPVYALFLIIPLLSIIMVFTDPLHHLFFVHFSLYSSEAVYGAYYYFHSIYSYSCIAAGVVLMLIAAIHNSGFFSRQSLLVISGVFITAVPNILYSFGVGHLPFSVSVAAFTLSILCFLIAFIKYRFITAMPITLRNVVDLISDGYLVLDAQHCIVSYNKALLNLLPRTVSITLGTNLRSFIEKYFKLSVYDMYLTLQAQAETQRKTVSTELHISGDTYVSAEITPVIQHNASIGSIILLKDITQSKQLIEVSRAESRYKSEFLSNMSHEIRTPMNAIIGMVNIGKSSANIERKDHCFSRIEDASKHLMGIINDILDLSKIEAGKFELSPEIFVFEKMLARVENVVKFRADEKNQTLTVNIDNNIPETLSGDDQRLAQVITNLIGNAVKFTPEHGSITLNTKLLAEENNVCTIQFDVKDSGIGISPEQQARLFQSFSQAETSTSRKFGGTGLGLSISKRIIEMMNGKVWIESELGKGATFSFIVQLLRSAKEKQDLPEQSEKQSKAEADITGLYKGVHILLAEDVEVNREIVMAMLENSLIEIDCAENGEEAVRMFSEAPDKYKMIFMDVQMPVMDGYEATRRIRKIEALSERPKENVLENAEHSPQLLESSLRIPIIAMTANVFRQDIEKCLESGMNDHIGKPLTYDDVLKQLKQYLGKNP